MFWDRPLPQDRQSRGYAPGVGGLASAACISSGASLAGVSADSVAGGAAAAGGGGGSGMAMDGVAVVTAADERGSARASTVPPTVPPADSLACSVPRNNNSSKQDTSNVETGRIATPGGPADPLTTQTV